METDAGIVQSSFMGLCIGDNHISLLLVDREIKFIDVYTNPD